MCHEVAPADRRRGIGTQLLTAIRAVRPERRPLSTKVRPGNIAAQGFLTCIGSRVYQRCRGVAVDPRDPAVRRWVAQQAVDRCADLSGLTPASLAAVFARQYAWVHASWSPVGDADLLAQVAAEEVSEADLSMSFGAWVADRLVAVAVAFAFPSEVGLEIFAETVEPDVPDGVRLVATVVAAVLEPATRCGGLVRFDGHVSDPHLHPVLLEIPWHGADRVELVEVE